MGKLIVGKKLFNEAYKNYKKRKKSFNKEGTEGKYDFKNLGPFIMAYTEIKRLIVGNYKKAIFFAEIHV